jgi:hypothetical protein
MDKGNHRAPSAKFLLNRADGRFYFTKYGNRLEKPHRRPAILLKAFIENEHPRDGKGKFTEKGNTVIKDGKVDIDITETDYEKALTDRELKKECFLYARGNFQGKIFKNADTGRNILVSRDGLDKWNNATKSREQSISIKKLDIILENSRKIDSESDRKNRHTVDGYTYFSSNMNINGKPYKVVLLTRETHGKNSKYYYHYLEDIKIEPDSGLA